jgi:hypothetical protein
VCYGVFYFTQLGDYVDQTVDIYVWDDDGGLPGNVICASIGNDPGPIAMWPDVSSHIFEINCQTSGSHFLGYWGDWPGERFGWAGAVSENGPLSCSVTKYAPGSGHPTGWGPVQIAFDYVQSLAIDEYAAAGPPEGGACCDLYYGTCRFELYSFNCEDQNEYWFEGQTCEDTVCEHPYYPNCCLSGGSCWVAIPCEVCSELGGHCVSAPCVPSPCVGPTSTEGATWGRIKSLYH